MTKKHYLFLTTGLLCLLLILSALLLRHELYWYAVKLIRDFSSHVSLGSHKDFTSGIIYFSDVNRLHLEAAKSNGISTGKKELDLNNLVKTGKLVEISSNDLYKLKKMPHSMPYLTPKANNLLVAIAEQFHKRLNNKGKAKCYFQVSSALRSREKLIMLRVRNPNASKNSAHLYGNTFDITYKQFIGQTEGKTYDSIVRRSLSESIQYLRNKHKCYVITERSQLCFHITAR